MTYTFEQLEELATARGIRLTTHLHGARGYYDHTRRVISLRHGLTDREARSTLAHELAHALHGDTDTCNPVLNARQERRADRTAAMMLIDPAELAIAEVAYGTDPITLARELDVSPHLIEVYRTTTPITFAA